MRYFEKIKFEQFSKDIVDDISLYNSFELPMRDSKFTAGYDIFLLKDLEIKPGEIVKIPTGIKSYFQSDEVLLIVLRSSMGFKYNLRLVNQIGIIDADYYENESNDGHIFVKIQNESKDTVFLKSGEAIVQGIFIKYLITKDDKVLGLERLSDY